MRLSDIMGHADLSLYPVVALMLFLFAFVAIVIYLLARRNQQTFEQARRLPLADDVLMPRQGGRAALKPEVGHG